MNSKVIIGDSPCKAARTRVDRTGSGRIGGLALSCPAGCGWRLGHGYYALGSRVDGPGRPRWGIAVLRVPESGDVLIVDRTVQIA
jgi:hypothetical protein